MTEEVCGIRVIVCMAYLRRVNSIDIEYWQIESSPHFQTDHLHKGNGSIPEIQHVLQDEYMAYLQRLPSTLRQINLAIENHQKPLIY